MNIQVINADMPETVKGVSMQKEEDHFTVLINDNLGEDERAAAFLHEMLHIWRGDFNRPSGASDIEAETHSQLRRIADIYKSE